MVEEHWSEVEVGDCLDVLRDMEDCSIDSIVTDPPYALSFMGKGWDKVLPPAEVWAECLRVAKPGSMLLAFGGTRTFHRLTCSIEDAGWEIRDCLMWLYGSGFPKSLDISKAIDKTAGATREVTGPPPYSRGKPRQKYHQKRKVSWDSDPQPITAPTTPEAELWNGWGTALKPAWEPIVLAMKPLEGTFAQNALKHGVAGLNVDGCRIGDNAGWSYPKGRGGEGWHGRESLSNNLKEPMAATKGRWPANVIHDGCTDERFFYCAKASKKDRCEYNNHPTVKPHELMRWLVRLTATPTGGMVLDPFCGSGSTGVACSVEGRDFLGIEMDPDYQEIALRRIKEACL